MKTKFRCPKNHISFFAAAELVELGEPFCSECEVEEIIMEPVEYDVSDRFGEFVEELARQAADFWQESGGGVLTPEGKAGLQNCLHAFFWKLKSNEDNG